MIGNYFSQVVICCNFFILRTLSQECQMMLFSATFDDKVMKFAETIIPDPIILRLKREEESLDNIKQYFVTCSNEDDKFKALANIYSVISIGQAMVFCRVSHHNINTHILASSVLFNILLCENYCIRRLIP